MVTYYDKCCECYRGTQTIQPCWSTAKKSLALVRRPQLHAQDEAQLKTAAEMADSGDIREVAEKFLKGLAKDEEDESLQKVEADPL